MTHPLTLLRSILTVTEPGIGRLQVDPGEAAYHEKRQRRISYELAVTATPLVMRFSSPVGFTIYNQTLSCDQGGIKFQAWRGNQGTPGGTFSTAVQQWLANGADDSFETPANPITIFTGGTFTPAGGQTPPETIRVFSNAGGGGPASQRQTVGGTAPGERGLPAGDYYLVFSRLAGTSVDGLGVFDLVYAANRV